MKFRDVQAGPMGEVLLSAFECTGLARRSAIYISTPITSGAAILRWYRQVRDGSMDATPGRHAQLVRENIRDAEALILATRARYRDERVVEPTKLLDVPGFEQPDYHRLWCAFIERYSKSVIFNSGWEFSTGCAAEFATAALNNTVLLDDQFRPLSVVQGLHQLERAANQLQAVGRPADLHLQAIADVGASLSGKAAF